MIDTLKVCPHERKERRRQLRLDVKLMRHLSVLQWEGVWLGPEPTPPPPVLSEKEQEEAAKQRHAEIEARRRDTLFAASSIRPKLPGES